MLFHYGNTPETKIHYCHLLIAMINFECSNHSDDAENITRYVIDDMVEKLNLIIIDCNIRCSLEFVKCWKLSVQTTCCYQVLVDCGLNDFKVEVIQFFCFIGWGICYSILDF